ncbi:MAG: outer membrane protein transport protein [Bacteroidales bacterium]|nr:outer membrane protein transport protein [Bacteroidales bacterium]
MKKILVILFISISISMVAQNEVDALRYSQNYYMGTARFMSTGGAFSSLAADMSAISINPAVLGKYKGSEITISPYFALNRSSALYNNTTRDNFRYHFQRNIGFVLNHNNGQETDWKSVSFAFAYNRLNDFSRIVSIDGYNNQSSMTDYFAALANGKKVDELDGFNEGLAWDAYIIDPDTNGTNLYKTAFANYGEKQTKTINTKGGMGEYLFAISGNYKDQLFIGMSMGIQSVRYREFSYYSEKDDKDTIPSFNYFDFNKELKTTGSGFNFKFGMIYTPVHWFRLGLAMHTSTFFNLTDSYSSSIKSSFNDNLHGDGKEIKSKQGLFDYELTTPFKAIASIGFVVYNSTDEQKVPFVNVALEYEYVDYSMARLYSNSYGFDIENSVIEKAYRPVGNIRAGVELRLSDFLIRGGYSYYQSPYESNQVNANADKTIYSIGFGIKGDYSYFDLGFLYSTQKEKYYLYDPSIVTNNAVSLTNNNYGMIATLGFRF